jgi:tRNA threonylcarbamoyladenosine biosynthesis protein TsaE
MFRIFGLEELESTGFFDYIERGDCVLAIEWSENVEQYIAQTEQVVCTVELIKIEENKRKIKIMR